MTLPIHHPFWIEIVLVFAVMVVSAVVVYARADHIVAREILKLRGISRVRRDSAAAGAGLALVAGVVASAVYSYWIARAPSLAPTVFLFGAVVVGVALSALALVLAFRRHMRGAGEVIALNVIWAVAYGWLLPLAVVWWTGS